MESVYTKWMITRQGLRGQPGKGMSHSRLKIAPCSAHKQRVDGVCYWLYSCHMFTMDVTVHQLCISRDFQLLAAIGIKTSGKV